MIYSSFFYLFQFCKRREILSLLRFFALYSERNNRRRACKQSWEKFATSSYLHSSGCVLFHSAIFSAQVSLFGLFASKRASCICFSLSFRDRPVMISLRSPP